MTTQYFAAGSIYRLTPTTEAIARAVAEDIQPEPVSAWELQRALPAPAEEAEQEGVDDEDDDEDDDDE